MGSGEDSSDDIVRSQKSSPSLSRKTLLPLTVPVGVLKGSLADNGGEDELLTVGGDANRLDGNARCTCTCGRGGGVTSFLASADDDIGRVRVRVRW